MRDVNALESTNLSCLKNLTTGNTVTGPYTSDAMCGPQYSTGVANSNSGFPHSGPYIIWSAKPEYQGQSGGDAGSCETATAGRSWFGYGNYGCSITKFFVR